LAKSLGDSEKDGINVVEVEKSVYLCHAYRFPKPDMGQGRVQT